MRLRAERSLTGCGRNRARSPGAAGPRAPAAGGAGRRGAGLAKGACPAQGGRGAGTAPPLSLASLFQTQAGIVTSPPGAPSQRAACSRPTWVRRLAIGRRRRGRPGFVPPPRRPASPERSGGGGADRVLRRCLGPRRHPGSGGPRSVAPAASVSALRPGTPPRTLGPRGAAPWLVELRRCRLDGAERSPPGRGEPRRRRFACPRRPGSRMCTAFFPPPPLLHGRRAPALVPGFASPFFSQQEYGAILLPPGLFWLRFVVVVAF